MVHKIDIIVLNQKSCQKKYYNSLNRIEWIFIFQQNINEWYESMMYNTWKWKPGKFWFCWGGEGEGLPYQT